MGFSNFLFTCGRILSELVYEVLYFKKNGIHVMTALMKEAYSGSGLAIVQPTRGRAREVDAHVGQRIRERRTMMGLTQQQLADLIGVTYQQAHKYERGINRVSAGRLFDIASALSVNIEYFYDGLNDAVVEAAPRQRMCLELARNFGQITNERHQKALSSLARALVEE